MSMALVIGFGLSGRSAAKLLLEQGWKVVASDLKARSMISEPEVKDLLKRGVVLKEEGECLDVAPFQLAILSPGISPELPLVRQVSLAGIDLLGEIEFAFRSLRNPILGITGTNGKTTVSLLAAHLINRSGKKARALGNVGVPLSAEVNHLAADETVVLELSSYQLETLKSPLLQMGVILNITPDHLDRYASMECYAEAKIHMKNCLKPHGRLLVEENTYKQFKSLFNSAACQQYGYQPDSYYFTDLKCLFRGNRKWLELPLQLQGRKSHDLENFIAACALCEECGLAAEDILNGFSLFQKPHHRIEEIATLENVHFFDDSKGTNVDAVIRAVETMQGPTRLIAGGVDKGASYISWISAFQNKVVAIYVIGQAAKKIEAELSKAFPVYHCRNLREAVELAYQEANPRDNILLSPGCASFDMFDNYAHRGKEFQRFVRELRRKE